MRGFVNFTWLGHDIKHTHHAHVREMHVIDRHHAWADRSRSFGFPQPRFDFGLQGTFMGGCESLPQIQLSKSTIENFIFSWENSN